MVCKLCKKDPGRCKCNVIESPMEEDYSYNTDLTKRDWQKNRSTNIDLIAQYKLQIMMAEEVIGLCERKIKEFPVEKIPELEKKEE